MVEVFFSKVDDDVIKYFKEIEFDSNDWIDLNRLSTVNGKQTRNVIHKIDPNLIKYLIDNHLMNMVNQIKGDYTLDGIEVDYLHYIKYEKGGYQRVHSHKSYEDYSFIIYLDDGQGGETIIYPYGVPVVSKVTKGNLVFFPSYLFHEGAKILDKKEIIVGSIREIGKKWTPRKS